MLVHWKKDFSMVIFQEEQGNKILFAAPVRRYRCSICMWINRCWRLGMSQWKPKCVAAPYEVTNAPFICFFIECGNFPDQMKISMKFRADMPDIPSAETQIQNRVCSIERILHWEKLGNAEDSHTSPTKPIWHEATNRGPVVDAVVFQWIMVMGNQNLAVEHGPL